MFMSILLAIQLHTVFMKSEVNILADGLDSTMLVFNLSGLDKGCVGLMRRPVCESPTFPFRE